MTSSLWCLLSVVLMYFSVCQALQHGVSSHRIADGINFTPNPNRKDLTQLDNNAAAFAVNEAENFDALMTNRGDYRNLPSMRHGGLGNHVESSPALVLNADYTPLNHLPLSLWNWQDTLRAVFGGKAIVVSEYADLYVRSVSCTFRLPSVIALTNYQRVINKVPVMSRRNVYIRDGFRCQYCNEQFPISELSLDHVVPRARGGKLTWTNTVSACLDCNYKKGQTPPEDLHKIGMKLRSLPRAPSNRYPTYQTLSYSILPIRIHHSLSYHNHLIQSELQFKAKTYKKSLLHPHWAIYIS